MAACSSGGGGGESSGAGGNGGGGGGAAPPASPGDTVALLETSAPAASSFLLRGTVPLPPDVHPSANGMTPLAVLDADGSPVVTQVEVVSRYADESRGADVVELIARVQRPPGASPGDRIQYEVTLADSAPPADPGAPDPTDLTSGPELLPASVQSLLSNDANVVVSVRDVFGNEYTARPLRGAQSVRLLRYGPRAAQIATYEALLPTPPAGAGALPHHMGVHAYVTTWSGEEAISLDLRFNNGFDGQNGADPIDDGMQKLYFDSIRVAVPPGWTVQQAFDDPMFGAPVSHGGKTVYPIVEPMPSGDMHVLRSQGQFHRRLVLAPAGKEAEAASILREDGLAFCRRGIDPDEMHEYWSWWNVHTARFFPQKHILPSLEHVGHATIRGQLASELAQVENHLKNGTSQGSYPIQSGNLGWGHPYGVAYGGMTGGDEIWIYDGVKTAEAASTEGYRQFQAIYRMHVDRHPTALFDQLGMPSSVEDWVVDSPGGGYVPFFFFNGEVNTGTDPFGFDTATMAHVNEVMIKGLNPGYEMSHLKYDAIDTQHLVRNTRSAKVLCWLGNDAIAKDDILMQAESFQLSYHHYYNSASQHVQETGLLADQTYVAGNPGQGFNFGRGEGWGIDIMNAAYAIQSTAWRAQKYPWFQEVAQVASDGQGSCNGFMVTKLAAKTFNGIYKSRKAIEQAILENSLRSVRETVFRGVDPAHVALIDSLLSDSYYSWASTMAWTPGKNQPWQTTAVGPPTDLLPVWCNVILAADQHEMYTEGYQCWSSFGYAFELTGDQLFLDRATTMTMSPDLLTGMTGFGLDNIYNRAALLAVAQKLNGVF